MGFRRNSNLFMLLVLVFTLMFGNVQSSVYAESQENEETISVIGNISIGDLLPETVFTYEENKTALDVLIKTVGANNVDVSESAYGKMITGINGLKAKDTNFWGFYINGISAQVGADSYIVQKGDQLSFRYVNWTVAPEKTVSIQVAGKDGLIKEAKNIEFIGESTAFQLLKIIFADKLVYSESQYGKMITSIDEIKAEGTNYWAFYVNGQMGTVGADSYKLKAGDQISFQYESWEKPKEETEKEGNQDNTKLPIANISVNKIQNAVDLASQYVLKNEVGEWEAIALRQAGKKIPENYLTRVTELIKNKKGKFSKITDYERYTLGILAAGGDPTNIAGYNLVESIYNGDVTKQGLNGVFYALIALNSADFQIPSSAKWSKEKLINDLLEKKNQDGGWSWDGSEISDIDSTAMVLTALSPYKAEAEVKSSIDAGVQYLSAQFMDGKIDNSSTAAQIVIALNSIGIDAKNKLFIKSDTSLFAYLLSFQNADGGFDWQGGNESDVFSTGQAFQAIVSIQLSLNGKESLYNLPFLPDNNKPGKSKETNQKDIDNQNQKDQSTLEDEVGMPLPNTATNNYNYLALGLILMLIGAIFFIIEKRKKA